jgi:hypothetical protein
MDKPPFRMQGAGDILLIPGCQGGRSRLDGMFGRMSYLFDNVKQHPTLSDWDWQFL